MTLAPIQADYPLAGQVSPGRVELISTPGFAHGWAPLNLSRIKAFLDKKGHQVSGRFLCVEFSDEVQAHHKEFRTLDEEIGEFGYTWNELYFASLLFKHASALDLIRRTLYDQERRKDIYFAQLGSDGSDSTESARDARVERQARRIERYCRLMHDFLCRRVEEIDCDHIDLVGFSCVEAQFLTSLFLARQLKGRKGDLRVVFGGPFFQPYNVDALLSDFPEIDHIVIGEGEVALHEILTLVKLGKPVPRLWSRLAAPFAVDAIGRGTQRLTDFPPPNYDELSASAIRWASITSYMGKGCSHWRCSFCGISERGQQVRSADVVFEEIRHLVDTYKTRNINFGDWEINGDPRELEALCDRLIGAGITLDTWGEINARNTSRRLFHKMCKAGIHQVQVGIESFSPAVLRHIRKPATLLDNVKVLKWGVEAGMRGIYFNLLCNHPLSTREDAETNYRVLKCISHLLRPPVSFVLNEMDLYRTSDMFEHATNYDIADIGDYEYYRRCFPHEYLPQPIPMFNLAYRKHAVDPLWGEIDQYVRRVRRKPVRLTMRGVGESIKIYDTRGGSRLSYRLQGLDALALQEAGERIVSLQDLVGALCASPDDVNTSVSRLLKTDLLLEDKGRYFALPISLEECHGELKPMPMSTRATPSSSAK